MLGDICVVTGGLGFIGKNFALEAIKEYEKVHIVDKVTRVSDLEFYINELKGKVSLIMEDIIDTDLLDLYEDGKRMDIFHFAAESHVDRSFTSSMSFTKANALGTHSLLENVRTIANDYVQTMYDFGYIGIFGLGILLMGHLRMCWGIARKSKLAAINLSMIVLLLPVLFSIVYLPVFWLFASIGLLFDERLNDSNVSNANI